MKLANTPFCSARSGVISGCTPQLRTD